MTSTKKIGDKGEQEAVNYLLNLGYEILERNYRHKRNEIDIVAKVRDRLIFIEVKYRSNSSFGFGEDFVDDAKLDRLDQAANHYILESNWEKDIRFDIIAVSKKGLKHFEDVF